MNQYDKDADKAMIGVIGLIWAIVFIIGFTQQCGIVSVVQPTVEQHVEDAK